MELVFLALSPVILLLLGIFLFKKSLFFVAPFVFLYSVFLGVFYWDIERSYLVSVFLKGFLVSFDIVLIIFGAIFFLNYLRLAGFLDKIQDAIFSVSSNRGVLAIIIVWFFGSFIEGIAGFGTPAAITAPLLVVLGFPAVVAVIIALVGNSTAVIFGAVGTPFRVGFSGLDVSFVSQTAALINLVAGLLVPFFIIGIIVFHERGDFKNFSKLVPFALWSGLCFLVPYYLLSYLGFEFPSLLGAIIGLVIVIFSTKKGWFVPENDVHSNVKKTKKVSFSLRDFSPYLLLVLFLFLGKYSLPSWVLRINDSVTHSFSLFNPGFIFLLTVFIVHLFFKFKFSVLFNSFNKSYRVLWRPFVIIFFITGFVQLLILSKFNLSNSPGMLDSLSVLFSNNFLIVLAPFVGAFGSFLSGSATVSNLLFASLLFESAASVGFLGFLVLALQVVGAGVGNMVSLSNIIAAEATVHLKNKELVILKGVLVPALIYLVVVVLFGLLLSVIL